LTVTAEARAIGRAVLAPRAAGLPAPLSGVHALVSAGMLSPVLREAYGFHWDAIREARFRRAIKLIRSVRRVTPPALAQWRDARRHRR
jgi:uncharacterized protein (DUF2236 family)